MDTLQKKEVTSTGIVNASADNVWKKLIHFGDTEKFVPDLIQNVALKGKGIGAVRTIYLQGGGEIIEELTKINTHTRYFEFIILATPMPVHNYTGSFKVDVISEHTCEVTFTSTYNVLPKDVDAMQTLIKGFQETFISNLHK